MVTSSSEPDSEPSFESAQEELVEELRELQLEPVGTSTALALPEPISGATDWPEDRTALVPARRTERPSEHSNTLWLPSASLEPSLRQVTRREPVRFYSVWKIPRYQGTFNLIGVHSGPGVTAYAGLLSANQGEFQGLRFRRADNLREAAALFRAEAEQHGVERGLAENRIIWH